MLCCKKQDTPNSSHLAWKNKMRKLTSEKTKRKYIKELIAIYKSGKYKSLEEFKENEKELIEKLCRCSFKKMPCLLYEYNVLGKKWILWHKMNLPQVKESVILRWVDGNYKNVRKFNKDYQGLCEALKEKKKDITVREILNCYGFKTILRELKSKDQSELEAILVEDFEKYLGGGFKSFKEYMGHNLKVRQRLSDNYNITLTQVLVKYGYADKLNRILWQGMPIEIMEEFAVTLWNSGEFAKLGVLGKQNGALFKELKKHYQSPGDVIVKSRIKPKHDGLEYALDFVVCKYLKKRIKKSSEEELLRAVRSLNGKIVNRNKKLNKTLREFHNVFTDMFRELQNYATQVHAEMHNTKYRKIKPPKKE